MIPKIIHYCWFGGKPLPLLAQKCIKSWKKYCPDYELKLWNEKSFDIHCNDYVKEAYEAKKYAFITDYVRLWAIYTYGGIYMDTDVEVLKPLDCFLHHPAFSGFESEKAVPTGIMASEKGGKWAEWELKYYKDTHFRNADGSLNLTTNVEIITNNLVRDGFVLNNCYQEHKGIIVMYPNEYFCPKQPGSLKIDFTENTYTIHHFDGSWKPLEQQLKKKLVLIIQKYAPWVLPAIIALKRTCLGLVK